ncbi:MAG: hypothetical protein WBP12_03395 [Candidatus Saccharimonas sp.]
MSKVASKPSHYTWHKVGIVVIGLILSVVLHELFHIFMHWGEITRISFFQGDSVAEIIVLEHRDNDIEGEELAAYLITLLVMIVTVMTVYKISDASDNRSAQQIIFGSGNDAPKLKSGEFLRLADKAEILPDAPQQSSKATKPKPKR